MASGNNPEEAGGNTAVYTKSSWPITKEDYELTDEIGEFVVNVHEHEGRWESRVIATYDVLLILQILLQ